MDAIKRTFAGTKVVFANEDDGIFSAVPITLDPAVYTIETEIVNGRTIAKAGSVVKEGTVVRGILPEPYDITEGTLAARVALEGYAYASRMTPAAVAAAASLPKLVLMPFKAAIVNIQAVGEMKAIVNLEGTKFVTAPTAGNFTVTGGTLVEVKVVTESLNSQLELTFAAAGEVVITAIAAEAFTGVPAGITLKGLPLAVTVVA